MKYEGLSDELVKRLENLPPPEPRSRLPVSALGQPDPEAHHRSHAV